MQEINDYRALLSALLLSKEVVTEKKRWMRNLIHLL
jgi:hypothetical protein